MKISHILIVAILCCVHLLNAQERDSVEVKKSTIFNKLYYQLTFGVMASEREFSGRRYDPSITGAIGYEWKHYLQPGVSIGYDEYSDFIAMPLGIIIQGSMRKKSKSPIYFIKGGHAVTFKDGSQRLESTEGGRFIEAGLGYRWKYEKGALQISVGWKQLEAVTRSREYYYLFDDVARLSILPPGDFPGSKISWTMQRVVFRIGMVF